MTYEIVELENGEHELRNEDGDAIANLGESLTLPDDVIDGILSDVGVGKPQSEAFRALFTRDWEYVPAGEDE